MMNHTDKSGNKVSDEQAQAFIAGLTPEQVLSVYNGRVGCMCGCKGNHKYNPLHRDEASKDRGYEVDADECSSRSIVLLLNKAKKSGQFEVQDGYILHCRVDGKQYALYVRKVHALG